MSKLLLVNTNIQIRFFRNLLKMSTGTKNFSYHSARIWNTIASKISINVSLSQFKATLKNYLLHNPLVYLFKII